MALPPLRAANHCTDQELGNLHSPPLPSDCAKVMQADCPPLLYNIATYDCLPPSENAWEA
jgi:hypothetical protein